MENELRKLVKDLRLHFFLSLSLLLLLGLGVYFLPAKSPLLSQELSLPIQSMSLLLFLIGVPFTLRWFHHKTRRISIHISLPDQGLKAYRKAAAARMYAFSIIAFFALALKVFTTMPNAMLFFLMTMLFFLFCIPNKEQIIKELNLFEHQSGDEDMGSDSAFSEHQSGDEDIDSDSEPSGHQEQTEV